MSAASLAKAAELAIDAAVRLCWAQWRAMGSLGSAAGSKSARAVVDPEALVLLSAFCRNEERRLVDLVAWWADVGSQLTSVQRMRSVASRFPGRVGTEGLELFASFATKAGDRRWRKHATAELPTSVRTGKGPDELMLIEASALWPRLRAAFGVGAKADALAFLLGLQGGWASASVISFATGYSQVAVRQAAGDMALARLVRVTEGRPAEYLAPPHLWADLLELHPTRSGREGGPLPPWRFWSEVAAFLAGTVELFRRSHVEERSGPYVVASAARDLVERHTRAFNLDGIPVPPVDAFPGLEMVRGLEETVRVVSAWIEEAV